MGAIEAYLSKNLLCCSMCHGDLGISGQGEQQFLQCNRCKECYRLVGDFPMMVPRQTQSDEFKRDIQRFWGELYRAAYSRQDKGLDQETFKALLDDMKQMFTERRHMAVVEMPIYEIAGKEVLEIGSGAGAHAALFASHGAHVTAVDLSPERVLATSRKLSMIPCVASACSATRSASIAASSMARPRLRRDSISRSTTFRLSSSAASCPSRPDRSPLSLP